MSETVAEIAERFPIGTWVRYWPVRGAAESRVTKIRSAPWKLGNGTIIIKIEGQAGGVHCKHLQPLPQPPQE